MTVLRRLPPVIATPAHLILPQPVDLGPMDKKDCVILSRPFTIYDNTSRPTFMARHTVLIEQHHPPPELKGNGTWIWRPRVFPNFDYAVSYAKQQITDADLNWMKTR